MLAALVSCQQKAKHRNVLFILADDFGYNDISYRNDHFYETPNIDGIAKEGMDFTNGYATCQVCSPSRASIMTGQFPVTHGVTNFIGDKSGEMWRLKKRFTKMLPAEYVSHLPHGVKTLPEAMQEAGYTTFFAGKWHLGDKGSWPEDHGFDINIGGFEKGSPMGGYFSPYKNPNLENKTKGENLSLRLANETINFMKGHKDEPFFAFLSFYAVHSPIQTTEEKWRKYRQKAENNSIAESGYKMGKYMPIRQTQDNPVYGGLVETMDDAVGMVLSALEELGLDENTMVVFTSDNGGVAAGDNFSTSNKPLRAGKGYQYEGGIREPYFVKAPWLNIAGKTCDVPVTGTDFYPTILDALGLELEPTEHVDGVSLLPLLEGDEIGERPLIWHYPHYGNQGGEPSSIIREGKWKLIHYYEDGRTELFNLEDDMEENSNVVTQHIDIAKRLDIKLFDFLKKNNALYPTPDPEYNAALEEASIEKQRTGKMIQLEKNRKRMLSADFKPSKTWWGSQEIND